jgi:hypothetical protein
LRFYKSLAFQIQGAGGVTRHGPQFWALTRRPR